MVVFPFCSFALLTVLLRKIPFKSIVLPFCLSLPNYKSAGWQGANGSHPHNDLLRVHCQWYSSLVSWAGAMLQFATMPKPSFPCEEVARNFSWQVMQERTSLLGSREWAEKHPDIHLNKKAWEGISFTRAIGCSLGPSAEHFGRCRCMD